MPFNPAAVWMSAAVELGKTVISGHTDWDARVRDRISKLKEDEIGYQKKK